MELESSPGFILIDNMAIGVDVPCNVLDLLGEIHLTIISTRQVQEGKGTDPH
jgi:hypothetical protein